MTTPNLTIWLTQSDAARRLGVSREAIRQAIAAGRIDWNGRTGRDCRVRGELLPARTLPPLTRAPKHPARRAGKSPAIVPPTSAPTPPARTKSASHATASACTPKGSLAPKGSISSAPKGSIPSAPKAPIPADKLLEARLQKLEADTALQTMRLESRRQEIYAQAMTDFQTAYESAFTPLKKFLLSLDLPAETLRELARIADQCDADFQSEITP